MPAHKLIIDCDPGLDDAIALLLAFASPELDVLAITVAAGNVGLERTVTNTRQLVDLAGVSVPIHPGCPAPLFRRLETAAHIHGDSGMRGAEHLPSPQAPVSDEHAVQAIIRLLRTHAPGEIILACTGPLTNLAAALIQAPDIAPRIARIVVMGGGVAQGNATPAAEFNFLTDPHAADIVCRSGAPLEIIPLDLTWQAEASPARLAPLTGVQTAVAQTTLSMMAAYGRRGRHVDSDGPPLHDPCVIGHILWPDLMTGKTGGVSVDVLPGPNEGRLTADWWGVAKPPLPQAKVLLDIDADAFFARLCDRLLRYS